MGYLSKASNVFKLNLPITIGTILLGIFFGGLIINYLFANVYEGAEDKRKDKDKKTDKHKKNHRTQHVSCYKTPNSTGCSGSISITSNNLGPSTPYGGPNGAGTQNLVTITGTTPNCVSFISIQDNNSEDQPILPLYIANANQPAPYAVQVANNSFTVSFNVDSVDYPPGNTYNFSIVSVPSVMHTNYTCGDPNGSFSISL